MFSLSSRLQNGRFSFVIIGLTFLQVTEKHATEFQMGLLNDLLGLKTDTHTADWHLISKRTMCFFLFNLGFNQPFNPKKDL